jgi:phosphate starvation-inducible PhoH-like protein
VAKQSRAKGANRPNPRADRGSNNFGTPGRGRNKRYGAAHHGNDFVDTNKFDKPKKQRVEIIPRNLAQENFLASLENPDKYITFAVGPAGTGKTYIPSLYAAKMLKEGKVEKIVITRPNVAVDDKDIGYLPGDILAKMSPWCKPVISGLEEFYTTAEIEYMIESEIVQLMPIAYIRGLTFKNSFIIFDEAQNSTTSSLLSVLTRLGEGSRLVVTGDIKQSDRGRDNGLNDFIHRFTGQSKMIDIIEFQNKDVERHPAIKDVLEIYKDFDL